MSCRKICRELLWLARFGEFGPSSQPHLDHLASCRPCRDEVGFDRAMVEQLRIALAERIAIATPPSTAWDRILARAQAPETPAATRFWEWSTGLVARLRWATAMAGTGLALVLALNMEVVPISAPEVDDGAASWEASSLTQVPRIPVQRSSLEQLTRAWGGGVADARPSDPEAELLSATRGQAPPRGGNAGAEPEPEPNEAPAELRLVFRPSQTPEPGTAQRGVNDAEGDRFELIESEPGLPS